MYKAVVNTYQKLKILQIENLLFRMYSDYFKLESLDVEISLQLSFDASKWLYT